jgi:phosphatidylserine/phosphatidylglycerophosphate/cardiolipin synthase-like enzyme
LPEWEAALLNYIIPFRECEVDLLEDLEISTPDSKAAHLKYIILYRECEADLPEDLETPPPDSKAALLRESKRFMIYVHSKLMIVDDSVAIVGKNTLSQ